MINEIKKFFIENPIELYILWIITIITVLTVLLSAFNCSSYYDQKYKYIQYHL